MSLLIVQKHGGHPIRWRRIVHDMGVAAVVDAIGRGMWTDETDSTNGIEPCPICRAKKRYTKSKDKRGAVSVWPNDMGWQCFQCGARGDAVDLAALILFGVKRPCNDNVFKLECARVGLLGGSAYFAAWAMDGKKTSASSKSKPNQDKVFSPSKAVQRVRNEDSEPIWAPGQIAKWWNEREVEVLPHGQPDRWSAGRELAGGQLGRQSAEIHLHMTRGFPRGNWDLVESGYASIGGIDEIGGWPKVVKSQVSWMFAHNRLLLVPIRSAANNQIVNIALKGYARKPRNSLLKGAPVIIDGVPCGYGAVGASLRANLLVLCEGAMDTMVAEALLRESIDATAIGATCSETLRRHWAPWLAKRTGGQVVVVYHRDANETGLKAAKELAGKLHDSKVDVSLFAWREFLDRVYTQNNMPKVNDLADVSASLKGDPNGWETLKDAFCEALRTK